MVLIVPDMSKPDTFRTLIASLGGVAAFADKTGIGEFAAKKMRDRNSIAVKHWPAVLLAASDGGIVLTNDDLVAMSLVGQPGQAA